MPVGAAMAAKAVKAVIAVPAGNTTTQDSPTSLDTEIVKEPSLRLANVSTKSRKSLQCTAEHKVKDHH